jgi:Leu/Phe-tRNA-protein transferase
MPIFRLVDDLVFPPPDYADPSGLIAVGGDLSSKRLLEAYRVGIFPWYSDDQPIPPCSSCPSNVTSRYARLHFALQIAMSSSVAVPASSLSAV